MTPKCGPNWLKLFLLASVAALAFTCVGTNCCDAGHRGEMCELIAVAGAAGAAIGILSGCEKLADRSKSGLGAQPAETECVTLRQLRREWLREAEIGLAAGMLIVIGYTICRWLF